MNMCGRQGPKTLIQCQLVAVAMLVSSLIQGGVCAALFLTGVLPEGGTVGGDPGLFYALSGVFLFLGLLHVVASAFVRRMAESRLPEGAGLQRAFTVVVIAMALAEVPGVMGTVLALMFGQFAVPVILWGAAVAGCAYHFPTQTWADAYASPPADPEESDA